MDLTPDASGYLPTPRAMNWIEIWLAALTRPKASTYEEIIADPGAKPRRAYGWVFLATLISFLVSVLLMTLLGNPFAADLTEGQSGGYLAYAFIGILCAAPFVAVFSILSLIINSAIIQFIAGGFGGRGTFGQMVYATGAFLAPMTVVSSVIGGIPLVNCLGAFLGIYSLVLNVIAIKAVNQFDYGKAVLTLALYILGVVVLTGFLVAMTFVLLGPSFGSVFSNIIESGVPMLP